MRNMSKLDQHFVLVLSLILVQCDIFQCVGSKTEDTMPAQRVDSSRTDRNEDQSSQQHPPPPASQTPPIQTQVLRSSVAHPERLEIIHENSIRTTPKSTWTVTAHPAGRNNGRQSLDLSMPVPINPPSRAPPPPLQLSLKPKPHVGGYKKRPIPGYDRILKSGQIPFKISPKNNNEQGQVMVQKTGDLSQTLSQQGQAGSQNNIVVNPGLLSPLLQAITNSVNYNRYDNELDAIIKGLLFDTGQGNDEKNAGNVANKPSAPPPATTLPLPSTSKPTPPTVLGADVGLVRSHAPEVFPGVILQDGKLKLVDKTRAFDELKRLIQIRTSEIIQRKRALARGGHGSSGMRF